MVYLISLILLLLPTYLLRFSVFGIPTTVLEILIYIIFLYGIYRAIKIGFRPIPREIYLPIGFLIIALIISTIIAPAKNVALGEFKGFFIDAILVFWLIFQFVREKDMPVVFWGLIGSGAFVAVDTIIQRILGHTTADGRVIGIFGYSPNYVALYLAPIAVLLIAYGLSLIVEKKYWFFVICYLLSAICLAGIYFSGSRGGVLAVAAGVGVFLIANFWGWIRKHLSSQIIIAILIIMAIYTSWELFKPNFAASLSSGRVVTSNNLRWQIWQTTLELGAKHLILGVGLGNFQNAFGQMTATRGNFPEYITPQALTPHNIFLMFYLTTGLLGLLSFLCLIVVFFWRCFRQGNAYSSILLAMMTAILAYGLVDSSIWKNDLSIIFWTVWGLSWVI